MYLFKAIADCHQRLLVSAEALRVSLEDQAVSPKFLRLRFEMSVAARDNLATTQRLWARIEREFPDIGKRTQGYDHLKDAERELHIRYANHIAAWPVAAISADFAAFARAKKQFLDDLCRHIRSLDAELFEPACRMLERNPDQNAQAA